MYFPPPLSSNVYLKEGFGLNGEKGAYEDKIIYSSVIDIKKLSYFISFFVWSLSNKEGFTQFYRFQNIFWEF